MKKSMKGFHKIFRRGIAALAALILVLTTAAALAPAAHAAYTYTVRVYSGSQGTFNSGAFGNALVDSKNQRVDPASVGASIKIGSDEVIISGIPASDSYGKSYHFVYVENMVVRSNEKYLVRGLRESGKDNNTIGTASFEVNRDKDLVVGYYIASGVVPYTINYVDEEGNPVYTDLNGQMVSSETHYGNAGDQMVVAFPYVEGYQPKAFSGVFTLKADQPNVYNFPYRKLEVPEETSSSEEESSSSEGESTSASSSASESSSANAESSSAASSSAAAVTDAAGNPVPTNADGSPVATDAAGNPVYPTDADGNPVPTDANGNLAPTDAEGRVIPTDAEGNTLATDEEGNVIEPSGGESETDETESGSEEETEESSSEIPETMNFDDETSGPAASSDFESEESSNGGQGETTKPTEPEGKKTFAQKLLDIIKRPIFIIGSLLGVGLIILLIILLTKNRKKNDDLNIEEKNGK